MTRAKPFNATKRWLLEFAGLEPGTAAYERRLEGFVAHGRTNFVKADFAPLVASLGVRGTGRTEDILRRIVLEAKQPQFERVVSAWAARGELQKHLARAEHDPEDEEVQDQHVDFQADVGGVNEIHGHVAGANSNHTGNVGGDVEVGNDNEVDAADLGVMEARAPEARVHPAQELPDGHRVEEGQMQPRFQATNGGKNRIHGHLGGPGSHHTGHVGGRAKIGDGNTIRSLNAGVQIINPVYILFNPNPNN